MLLLTNHRLGFPCYFTLFLNEFPKYKLKDFEKNLLNKEYSGEKEITRHKILGLSTAETKKKETKTNVIETVNEPDLTEVLANLLLISESMPKLMNETPLNVAEKESASNLNSLPPSISAPFEIRTCSDRRDLSKLRCAGNINSSSLILPNEILGASSLAAQKERYIAEQAIERRDHNSSVQHVLAPPTSRNYFSLDSFAVPPIKSTSTPHNKSGFQGEERRSQLPDLLKAALQKKQSKIAMVHKLCTQLS